MKRSEFRIKVIQAVGSGRVDDAAARLAEEAGVEWDPEEPELPERVRVIPEGAGVPFNRQQRFDVVAGAGLEGSVWGEDLKVLNAVAREAAARYNAVGRLWRNLCPGEAISAEELRRIVAEEREKLEGGS